MSIPEAPPVSGPVEPPPDEMVQPRWDIGLGLKLVASFQGVSLCGGPYLSFDWVHSSGLLVGAEVFGTAFGGNVEYGGASAEVNLIGSRIKVGYSWSPHRVFTLRATAGAGLVALRTQGTPQALLIDRTEWALGFLPDLSTMIVLRPAPHFRLVGGITASFAIPRFNIVFEETTVAELGRVLLEGSAGVEVFW